MDKEKNKSEIDFSESLKTSDKESSENIQLSEIQHSNKNLRFTQLIIKYSGGIIKTKKQASYVLLAFILFALIASLYLILNMGTPQDVPGTEYDPQEGYGGRELPDDYK